MKAETKKATERHQPVPSVKLRQVVSEDDVAEADDLAGQAVLRMSSRRRWRRPSLRWSADIATCRIWDVAAGIVGLALLFQQITRVGAESRRDPNKHEQGRIAATAFNAAEVGQINL